MANHPFPWSQTPTPEPVHNESAPTARRRPERTLKALRVAAPFAGFLLLLSLIYFSRSHADAAASVTNADVRSIDALVVMLPIAKGSAVPTEILKQIPLLRNELTKSQMLQLIRPDDLEKLRGRIRAKKNLPPNKPLLWSDIEFQTASEGAAPLPTTSIVFSKEN